jgi:hypothetical protein
MGYDLHITRKKNWDGFEDENGREISLEAWIALVEADSEMRLDCYCEVPLPDGGAFRHADPSLAVWTRWSHHGEAGDMAWFELRRGNIAVKNPDREIRRKMWRIARRLDAEVQGDDGEFYDRFGNPTPDAASAQNFWRALFRHLGFKFIWDDPVGGDIPPAPFARFPVIDSFTAPPRDAPTLTFKRTLNIVIPKGSATPELSAAIEAAREKAKAAGVDLIITEK